MQFPFISLTPPHTDIVLADEEEEQSHQSLMNFQDTIEKVKPERWKLRVLHWVRLWVGRNRSPKGVFHLLLGYKIVLLFRLFKLIVEYLKGKHIFLGIIEVSPSSSWIEWKKSPMFTFGGSISPAFVSCQEIILFLGSIHNRNCSHFPHPLVDSSMIPENI